MGWITSFFQYPNSGKGSKIDEFVEWEEVYKDLLYGTLKSEIERIWENGNHVIFDVDVKGGMNLKKIFGQEINCNIYNAPVSQRA